MSRGTGHAPWPFLGLLFNAFTWGLSWWPLRQLEALGLHPLWATVLMFALAVLIVLIVRPAAGPELLRHPALWLLVLASGATNAAFNWAVTIGDVVRVVLLFYLMPVWAVLLARVLLGERPTALALLRVGLALAGAAIVLWPAQPAGGAGSGWPLPRTLAEGLAVLGGFAFALNNVMLRHQAARSDAARALAMFSGGALIAGALALVLAAGGLAPWPPAPQPGWVLGATALGLWFLASNLTLQFGATRLPANITAVVMVSEVLFASVSAVLLGAAALTPALLAGGALIVGAALLAARG